jgi:hypothetical protein
MQNLDKRFNLVRRAPRRAVLVMSLAVACVAMGTAQAQVAVVDVPAETAAGTSATIAGAMQTFQTGMQYATFVSQLTQLTSTIGSIASNPLAALIPSTSTMTLLSQDQIQSLITAKCSTNSTGGNIITSALQSAVQSMNINSSIQGQQQQICANIINAQADQYNATVILYMQIPGLQTNMGQLQGLMQQLNGVMGNSSSATTQTVMFSTQQQTQINAWNTRMTMDTQIVTALNQQQSTLAAVALNARPDLLGSAVQATALAAAFSLNQ